ncbi:MAG TPA: cyclic pyranopterin monophosphate synthase MoaC [Candidatus Thermoplasmatota archaeon]|nr:cyclic pyranopterin monophosphate synthase MoaC [Candidatus Thermoplasmatota archaeon]
MRLPDVTDRVPSRRMSVARGTLAGGGAATPEAIATARVAAVLAVKDAARLVPSLVSFQSTDAFCDVETAGEGAGVQVTVTVQAYARTSLAAAALVGVAAALVSLLESAGHPEGARILEVHTVQDIEG